MFYGQHEEDAYIQTLFPKDYQGVCVDIGAYDGQSASNTLYFEERGWRCLCVEPQHEAFQKCASFRPECVQCCISSCDKEDQEFTIFSIGPNRSAVSSLCPDIRLIQTHQHLIDRVETVKSTVRSLTSLLDELQFPRKIDFMSIDTENTELDVLRGIDFSKYDIYLLVIENNFNDPECENYLRPYGYKKIHRIAVNDFYAKKKTFTL